jgi:hypothetical protein
MLVIAYPANLGPVAPQSGCHTRLERLMSCLAPEVPHLIPPDRAAVLKASSFHAYSLDHSLMHVHDAQGIDMSLALGQGRGRGGLGGVGMHSCLKPPLTPSLSRPVAHDLAPI